MASDVIVSVCCTTFNQVNYVSAMLDGILSQETDFGFEVLVHDDASTDGTLEVLLEYEKKDNRVRLFPEEVNRFSEGVSYMDTILIPSAKGKYIALCEGDDFWCDPHKLQKQVMYMETHPESTLSTHAARMIDGITGGELGVMGIGRQARDVNAIELMQNWRLPTASFLFRADDARTYSREWTFRKPVGDFPRALYLATVGTVNYTPEPMSVYRYGAPASWTAISASSFNILIKNALDWTSMLENIDTVTGHVYHRHLVQNAASKVIRLHARTGCRAFNYPIANESWRNLSYKQTILAYALRALWLLGFDVQRTSWSGLLPWRLVRRGKNVF